MKKSSDGAGGSHRTVHRAGPGMAIGAAVGMVFGLLLLENLALGSAIGAGVGLVVGALADLGWYHETDSAE